MTPRNVPGRHEQIVALKKLGRSAAQIALKLGLRSRATVRYHLTNRCRCSSSGGVPDLLPCGQVS